MVMVIVVLFCLLNLTIIFGKKHPTLGDLFSAYFIFAFWCTSEIAKIIFGRQFKNSTQGIYTDFFLGIFGVLSHHVNSTFYLTHI